jgi:hypothetical protein
MGAMMGGDYDEQQQEGWEDGQDGGDDAAAAFRQQATGSCGPGSRQQAAGRQDLNQII